GAPPPSTPSVSAGPMPGEKTVNSSASFGSAHTANPAWTLVWVQTLMSMSALSTRLGFMKTILNIVWCIFGGFALALGYFLAGIIACLLMGPIPACVASFRMACYALCPCGRSVVQATRGTGAFRASGNLIWLLVAGLWLAIGHIITAAGQAITIIGIPLAIANVKMIPVTCLPFGRSIVPSDRIPFGYEPMVKL